MPYVAKMVLKSQESTVKKLELTKKFIRNKRGGKVINGYLIDGIELSAKQEAAWKTMNLIYEQQQYMYDFKVHSVLNRIVSFDQPWIRPIVRGKAKTNVEFGAKIDVSIEKGYARLEKASFEAYNESTVLQDCINAFYKRNGHYPEAVLVDKIYRNRENIKLCNLKSRAKLYLHRKL